jgi:hypothetical protein
VLVQEDSGVSSDLRGNLAEDCRRPRVVRRFGGGDGYLVELDMEVELQQSQ